MRRVLAPLRLERLGAVQDTVLSGRDDVEEAARIAGALVVAGVRLGGGGRRRRDERGESGESAEHGGLLYGCRQVMPVLELVQAAIVPARSIACRSVTVTVAGAAKGAASASRRARKVTRYDADPRDTGRKAPFTVPSALRQRTRPRALV